MPNWCYNYLTIEGDSALIADVKRILNRPYVKKHDNWNPETGKMEVKDYHYSNPVFAFHNIYNHIQDNVSDEEYIKQPDHKLGEPITFDGNHWYDWNVRNWGTKWDVGVSDDEKYPDTELMDESDNSLCYKFNTAWSPPSPAIEKLSAKYPELEITLSFEEETGWGGEILFVEGQGTEIEAYENKCRDCDELNTMEYCDNDCGEICSSCNYLGEADLDCVAECDTHKVYLDENHVPDYRMDEVNA
ncbi:hypothetical protein EB001_19760 [bacterium]|nr:hypothetical protein [bacterium]